MEILLLGAVVLLGVWVYRLSARIDRLEHGSARPVAASATAPEVQAPVHWSEVEAQANVQAQVYTEAQEVNLIRNFFAWCGQDWLMKLGGLLVVLGVAWFVSYAFVNDWIGPTGRIGLGLGTGALVLALGRHRIIRYVTQGSIVMVVGAVMMILTTYAAREVYDFFTPLSALVLMFGVSALLGVSAVLFAHRPLAYANAALVAVAPFLVVSAEPSVLGLLGYTLVLTVGALGIVALTGWRELVLIALGVVGVHSLVVSTFARGSDVEVGLMFAFAFTALFFVSAAFGMCRTKTGELVDVVTAILTGLFLYLWIMWAADESWQALLFIGWALVFALGAQMVYQISRVHVHFYAYGGVAIAYLGTATALLLDGPALIIAFSLESAALIILGYVVTRAPNTALLLACPFGLPLMLSVESIASSTWRTSVLHSDAVALLTIIAVALGIGVYFMDIVRREANLAQTPVGTLIQLAWTVVGVYLFVLVWLMSHALLADDTGTLVALVIYAVTGCGLYVHGKQEGIRWARLVGALLVGLVVARLLLIDVWDMALSGRVITFLTIGVLLMGVAWLQRSMWVSHRPVTSENTEEHHEN